jgi:hypothetical protein
MLRKPARRAPETAAPGGGTASGGKGTPPSTNEAAVSTNAESDWDAEARGHVAAGEVAEAITVVDRGGHDWIARVINLGAGFQIQNEVDLGSLYTKVLVKLVHRFSDPEFDVTRPLKPYLGQMCLNAGRDWRRAKRRDRIQTGFPEERLANHVAPVDPEADGGRLEREEMAEFLRTLIGTLPYKQRVVAKTYLENFGLFEKGNDFFVLASLVSKETGAAEKPDAVRKNLEEAFTKFQPALRGKGLAPWLPEGKKHEKPQGGNST